MRQSIVYLFVFDGMADWEASFAIAGINNPQFQQEPGRYRVVTAGLTRNPVTTMGGLRILPDTAIDQISAADTALLILPGGESWEKGENQKAVEVAHRLFAACIPVAAICGATLALARAGMLNDLHHTSNSREYLAATGYRGGSFYCDIPAVNDEGLLTASGAAPLEFAREIFKALNLYSASALDAWYALLKFGDVSRFAELECVAR